jgi:hypothetical protein
MDCARTGINKGIKLAISILPYSAHTPLIRQDIAKPRTELALNQVFLKLFII